jgi:hypothetical protein
MVVSSGTFQDHVARYFQYKIADEDQGALKLYIVAASPGSIFIADAA